MKHLEILDEQFDYSDELQPIVEEIISKIQSTKDFGEKDMLMCKLESILRENNVID